MEMERCKNPIVSVIMSIYNQQNREQLKRAVMSVLQQSFSDFEFIIYNDGSNEIVGRYLREFEMLDKRIVLISNPKNHGLAYSLNTCIDVAKGKYLARMDDDDVCMPDRLLRQVQFLEAHSEISYVGCNAFLLDDGGIWGERKMPENPGKHDFLKYSPFIHPTVMIRRAVFDGTAAYRASKDTWRCEDYELFMRLWKLGHRGCNLQESLLYYREDRNSYKKRKLRYRLDEMKLRYRNFKEMGMLYPLGWIQVLRPLAAALVPSFIIIGVKRLYHIRERRYEKRVGEEKKSISESIAERSGTV
ncbi:MAG: glycosyltransferase [Lachnospiraceae bacterium]